MRSPPAFLPRSLSAGGNQPKFWQILSPKNSFAKTSSALFRHLPEYLDGRTPKRKTSFPFLEKIGRTQIRKARNIFSLLVTADSPKGQRAIETFRAQYNKAGLNDESTQNIVRMARHQEEASLQLNPQKLERAKQTSVRTREGAECCRDYMVHHDLF